MEFFIIKDVSESPTAKMPIAPYLKLHYLITILPPFNKMPIVPTPPLS
jgi:hypothetical protein